MFSTKKSDYRGESDNNNEEVSSLSDRFSETLPQEMVEKIFSYFSARELGLFAPVSRKTEEETAFSRLPHCVVYAEPESYNQKDETRLAAIALLIRHPGLLFEDVTVTDPVGRKIKASPYRLILGSGDIWALKQVHTEILPSIPGGEAIAETQFKEQFPNCPWPLQQDMPEEAFYDERNRMQIEQVKTQLDIIVSAITDDPCTDGQATKNETTEAVAELCKIFAAKEGEIIKTGLHFPLGIMKEILAVYSAQLNPWSVSQLAFFSLEVIGGAEAALTAVDGQCIKRGLKNLEDMKEKGPDRTDGLFCCHPKGIPDGKAPLVGRLGRTMFVDPYDGASCYLSSSPGVFDWFNKNGWRRLGAWEVWGGAAWRDVRRCVECTTYGEQKQKSMGVIMQPRKEKSTHCPNEHNSPKRCVIS